MQTRAERQREHNRKWRAKNRDKVRAYNREYDKANPERVTARQKAYRERHPERVAGMTKSWKDRNREAMKEYRRKRLAEYAAHAAKRRAAILQAMPAWVELDAIEALYATAKIITESTGIPHSIDHIVPLVGRTVCGLHCLSNLQILESRVNISKGNRHWPDMA